MLLVRAGGDMAPAAAPAVAAVLTTRVVVAANGGRRNLKDAREEEAAARGVGIPAVAEGRVVFRMVKEILLLLLLLMPKSPFNPPPPFTPTPALAVEGAANTPPPGARFLVSREDEVVEEELLSSCIAAARLTPPPLPNALLSPRAGAAVGAAIDGSSANLCRLMGAAVSRSGEPKMTEVPVAVVVVDDAALDEEDGAEERGKGMASRPLALRSRSAASCSFCCSHRCRTVNFRCGPAWWYLGASATARSAAAAG